MSSLSREEIVLLHKTAELWEEFLKLPAIHPSHTKDVEFHLHAIQRIIGVRVAYRTNPDMYPGNFP